MNKRGGSLIELLLAIALAAMLLPALLTGFVASREGKAQGIQRAEASAYLTEMKEAMRSIREQGWMNVSTNGTYHPVKSATSWSLASGSETLETNFTRQIVITNVQRDSAGMLVPSGGVVDPSTKKVEYAVSWTEPYAGSVTSMEYLTRYLGNTEIVQTTQADFDGGTKIHTRSTSTGGGTIELIPSVSGGTFIDDFTTPVQYVYDSNTIEVTGGYAQLKNISGVVSGQTTNSGFDTNANGWTFVKYGTDISQTGSYVATGGTPGGYITITFPRSSNKTSGGYWYQPFTTTIDNPTSTLSFNWRVTAYPTAITSLHLYAWIDSVATGIPVTQVWDSGAITSTTAWSGTVTVNTAPYITTPGTYYLKVGAYIVMSPGNKGPYTLGFDNVFLTWSGAGTSYATDSPTIYPSASFSQTGITSWSSFSTTEIPNGGSIRYQLSTDNGVTWKYWNGSMWAPATLATQYNDTSTINTNIAALPVGTGQIKAKAFLISNGSQLVKLDTIIIGYNGTSGTNTGTFVSGSIDAGNSVAFNRLAWTESNTANTTTKLQIATNTDNTTWSFVGPDGTSGTYFTGGSGIVPLAVVNGRYGKYKIDFTSTNSDIPSVSDVAINYSP